MTIVIFSTLLKFARPWPIAKIECAAALVLKHITRFQFSGPINWILSLRMWKLPSRLSYAMYLFHVPIILIVANSGVAPIYFSVSSAVSIY